MTGAASSSGMDAVPDVMAVDLENEQQRRKDEGPEYSEAKIVKKARIEKNKPKQKEKRKRAVRDREAWVDEKQTGSSSHVPSSSGHLSGVPRCSVVRALFQGTNAMSSEDEPQWDEGEGWGKISDSDDEL